TPEDTWVPDVLEGFSRLSIPLGVDDSGPYSATLIRHDGANGHPILYIHGWSDYFYNPELAEAAAAKGYAFFALDLRRYGRSLRSKQQPGYIDDLAEYDAEINQAFEKIAEQFPDRKPILLAHSTGGLVAALWAHRHPGRLGALV